MLTGNSPIQVSNEEEAYNCECTPARPASSSNYKPKESEIIYVDDTMMTMAIMTTLDRVGDSVEFQIFKPNDQLNEPNEVIQIDVLYN
ncbi:hypothetical protein ACJIZ3_023779 [Penstemon smallii]|uniref:Uncharacterized protein n=1 Tax=Penstemon smallii TaxID=265156 RepID=A0ABD3TSF2_9LAMI